MSEAPPPLKCVTVGLVLVGFAVPLLWLLFAWVIFAVIFEGPAFVLAWPWDVLRVLWPALLGVQLVGHLLCRAVPRDWRMRGSETGAAVLTLLQLGLSLVFVLELWPELLSPAMTRLVVLLLWALRQVTAGVHLVFLTNFAPRVDQEALAQRAETLIQYLFLLPLFPILIALSFWVLPELANLRFPIVDLFGASMLVVMMLTLMGLGFVLELIVLMRFTQLHLEVYHSIDRYRETFAEKAKLEKAGWVDEPGG
jgi:hypothetical protein